MSVETNVVFNERIHAREHGCLHIRDGNVRNFV